MGRSVFSNVDVAYLTHLGAYPRYLKCERHWTSQRLYVLGYQDCTYNVHDARVGAIAVAYNLVTLRLVLKWEAS